MKRSALQPRARCNFAALVLKGQMEHGDSGAYFASFGGLKRYEDEAIERGWLATTSDDFIRVTRAGEDFYEASGLKLVGRTNAALIPPRFGLPGFVRGYLMDWTPYKPKDVPPCR